MIGRPSKFLYHISKIVLVDIVDRWLMLGLRLRGLILILVKSGSGFLDDGIISTNRGGGGGGGGGFRNLVRKLIKLLEIMISTVGSGGGGNVVS